MYRLNEFEGTWETVVVEENGRKWPAAAVARTRLVVAGPNYTLQRGGLGFHGTVTLLDSTAEPGAVDFHCTEGPDSAGKTFLGLYLLEGDELTVCVAHAGQGRPTSLEPRRGSGQLLFLLSRVSWTPAALDGRRQHEPTPTLVLGV
jgi:uncharacterized protein (TIGR03067 family)